MDIASLYQLYIQNPHITTDSRNCPENSIFFALRGTSFNGNLFATKALEQGCAYAVIDQPEVIIQPNERYILVEDSLKALQELASFHRKQLGLPIIQITGTNGKTTTKELVAAVLAQKYKVGFTQGNLNNHIGVPLTLLSLTAEQDIAVVETGANHPGEIKFLSELTDPDYGLITNVGIAHIEGFGSFEGVLATKGELYEYLRKKGGTAFIHSDNPHLLHICEGLKQIRYGTPGNEMLSVEGELIPDGHYLTFRWKRHGTEWHTVHSHIVGNYNLPNALAAVTVGSEFDVPDRLINEALASYEPGNNRSQWKQTERNNLIIDAYNANPTSMMAALKNFTSIEAPHKMVILGDMKELGTVSAEEHQHIVDYLETSDVEKIWLVGECFAQTRHFFRCFKDVEDVKKGLQEARLNGYTVLIKGSNNTRLYQLPEYL